MDSAANEHRVLKLFEAHHDAVWRLLRRFGVPGPEAGDATQQVFLILAERISDVRFGSERAFLFGTALRIATTLRRGRRREVLTPDTDTDSSRLPHPDELTDQRRARRTLDDILAQMDPSLRTVFVLYELEEFTTPEIAAMLEIPLGTAASRLRRGRERFRELVSRLSAGRDGYQ